MPPIKTLPIVERWDCSACGKCCRGNVVPLSDDDLQRLKEQAWDQHPAMKGIRTVVRSSWFGKRQLAQRPDGTCVFLMEDNRCRIHAEHGLQAKPLVCQMYPLQLVPQAKKAVLTLRRSCPSAAADHGRTLEQHRDAVKRLARQGALLDERVPPPSVTPRHRGSWRDALRVAATLERLLTDSRYPLVRRLAHGARLCSLLEKCKLGGMDARQTDELLEVLEEGSREEAAEAFRDRQPPSPAAAALFRQAGAEYVRLHSEYRATNSWRERLRLARAALGFALGRGAAPPLHASLPQVAFADLEQPLGPLSPELQQPLIRFYEANAGSLQYAVAARPKWALTEAFRALALAYPIALWLLRWCSHGRELNIDDVIEVVTIIDRGQGYHSLGSWQHRRRVAIISRNDGLERLIAWYAR